jgi:translocation protein SEC63
MFMSLTFVVSENDKEPQSSAKESLEKRVCLRKIEAATRTLRWPKLALLLALWCVFGWALYSAWQAKINYKPYDPFEVLGVPSGADEETIKAAFKKLSRTLHPDKVKTEDREKAESKFVEMSKAYKT